LGAYLIGFGFMDLVVILQVAFALGMVIFVHELGHFAVAKWCGVKCEKFYLGFDINGWKLFKFQWGETEYGIGVLPLGGYVKMLGQDDNPTKVSEEMERARQKESSGEGTPGDEHVEPVLDPRSYLAQSVPKRMAIISAGVVMNLIFAFIFAAWAYQLGVDYIRCEVGGLTAGSPAWRAGLLPGDRVLQIGERKNPRFRDLKYGIALGDIESGVDLTIQRDGVEEPIEIRVFPEKLGLMPIIGVAPPQTLEVGALNPPTSGYPTAHTKIPLKIGDEIVALDGKPLESQIELMQFEAADPDRTMNLTVRRKIAAEKDAKQSDAEQDEPTYETFEVEVPPNPMRRVGIVMALGPITAVLKGSPAEAAGIKVRDQILSIDGEPPVDPMRLGEWFRRRVGEKVQITLKRPDEADPVTVELVPEVPDWYEWPFTGRPVMSALSAGLAFEVKNQVQRLEAGSPAEEAGLIVSGDMVLSQVRLIPPEDTDKKKEAVGEKDSDEEAKTRKLEEAKIKLGDGKGQWPDVVRTMQAFPPGTLVELTLNSGETINAGALVDTDMNNPDRGFIFEMKQGTQYAEGMPETLSLAWRETKEAVFQVYRFLQKLSVGQVSPWAMGGPITIASAAGASAYRGWAELLIFLTLLSANLAVINFLPIPVLDGGHMVFLLFEGIRGKPASEKIIVATHYAGFVLILGLMCFVLFLDVNRLIEMLS
jgi:regulator of sigma E protease